MWSSTPQRMLFPLITPGSALLAEIDVATPPEFVYRHNSQIGHALLWGRMCDELQHDFRSTDRGRAWRRNRWRRSLPATFRRGHRGDPTGIARPSGHFLSRPASDPGATSRIWP